MPLDGIFSHFLALELNKTLTGARLDKVRQGKRFELYLPFRHEGKTQTLFLSATPGNPCLYLNPKRETESVTPLRFCMFLRKHLAGAKLLRVTCPRFERSLYFDFLTLDELGDAREKRLIFEFMGKHANLILLNDKGTILDALIHVDSSMNRVREILPAHPYQAAPFEYKALPAEVLDLLEREQIQGLGQALGLDASIGKALLGKLEGFSPKLIQALCSKAGVDGKQKVADLSAQAWLNLGKVLKHLLQQIVEERPCPTLVHQAGRPDDLVDFFPFSFEPSVEMSFGQLSALLTTFYTKKMEDQRLQQRQSNLRKDLQQELAYWRRKWQLHRADLEESQNYESDREAGDLLISSLHLVQQGMAYLDCEDFYHEMRPRRIELEVNRSPSWNANAYYKRYNKLKQKFELASAYVQQDELEMRYLESLLTALEHSQDQADLDALLEEWGQYRRPKPPTQKEEDGSPSLDQPSSGQRHCSGKSSRRSGGKSGAGQPAGKSNKSSSKSAQTGFYARKALRQQTQQQKKQRLPQALGPRRYRSSEGFVLLVGRNNFQNDQLSLKQAHPEDLWFHVQKAPGAHLILQCGQSGLVPSAQSLEEAAGLVAWFSQKSDEVKAHHGGQVLVDYCPARQLKKAKGAKPGMVFYEQYETLRVKALSPMNLQGEESFEKACKDTESSAFVDIEFGNDGL